MSIAPRERCKTHSRRHRTGVTAAILAIFKGLDSADSRLIPHRIGLLG